MNANKIYCFGGNLHAGSQLVKTVSHATNAANPTEVTNALIFKASVDNCKHSSKSICVLVGVRGLTQDIQQREPIKSMTSSPNLETDVVRYNALQISCSVRTHVLNSWTQILKLLTHSRYEFRFLICRSSWSKTKWRKCLREAASAQLLERTQTWKFKIHQCLVLRPFCAFFYLTPLTNSYFSI